MRVRDVLAIAGPRPGPAALARPRPRAVCAPEPVEDERQVRGRDAHAGVLHRDDRGRRSAASASSTGPPTGVYLIAFFTRFSRSCRSRTDPRPP